MYTYVFKCVFMCRNYYFNFEIRLINCNADRNLLYYFVFKAIKINFLSHYRLIIIA